MDPAAVRRAHGVRAAGAVLCTWLSWRWFVDLDGVRGLPAIELYGVALCATAALVIADPGRHARQVTMVCATGVVALATALAAVVERSPHWNAVVLLTLIFCSFAFRRWGLRAGELSLLATMAWYFGGNFGASTDRLGWFLLAAASAMAWLGVWQFVVLPYRPERDLERAVLAFGRRVGECVAAAERVVHAARNGQPSSLDDLDRQQALVVRTRRVIQHQFPGVLAPRGWTAARVEELQLAMFDVEHGLGQLVRALRGDALVGAPDDVVLGVAATLSALADWLGTGAAAAFDEFERRARELRVRDRQDIDRLVSHSPAASATRWLAAVVQIDRGAVRVARSAERVVQLHRVEAGKEPPGVAVPMASRRSSDATPAATVRITPRLAVHPTTALGVQAVVATALAMAAATALRMDHANWVFWSAFVVIAGSAGESLRRVAFRVLGTVAGTTVGVLVVVASPGAVAVAVLTATVAVFFAIFFAPVSYVWMVAWVNLAVVVVFSSFDAPAAHLVVQRPVSAALGAGIAAAVALLVVPVRVSARYCVLLAHLLTTASEAVRAWVDVALGSGTRSDALLAESTLRDAQAAAEQLLPGVAFESNPLVQARSPLSVGALHSAALMEGIDVLVQAVDGAAAESMASTAPGTVLTALRDRVCAELLATSRSLAGARTSVERSLGDLLDRERSIPPDLGSGTHELFWSLVGLHTVAVDFASAAGMPVSGAPNELRPLKGSV